MYGVWLYRQKFPFYKLADKCDGIGVFDAILNIQKYFWWI